ncbi:MAG: baseplate J/gp47 family protein [Acidocella sp.]|nr:baseplate J/gp47 family protein [Acidocella sp.]
MQLSMQNFSTLVEGMAASVQGAAKSLLDLTVGSVLRAILEANASVALWIQWLIVQVLASTRLATSNGVDCDSFGADFGFIRLPAIASVGQVTFSRFTPNVAAFIPVGTNVSVVSNTLGFMVIADPTNASYSANSGGYELAAGVAGCTVMIVANAAGAAGNVEPGSISIISSALPGIDTVANQAALTGGFDAESDVSFRYRFGNYLASLSKATDIAIGAAVAGIQQGLSYVISENINQAGGLQPGHFVVTVDDGSGVPPVGLLSLVQSAVEAVRPVGSSFAVQGPVVLAANISMDIATSAGISHQTAIGLVAGMIESYVAGLSVGATLSYTRLVQLAYAASLSVTNVSNITLNGGSSDLAPPFFGVIRVGTVAVA